MILWRGLRKLDITRKKKTQHANEQRPTRCPEEAPLVPEKGEGN